MRAVLITLSLLEVAVVLAVLVVYLVAVSRSLRRTSATLGKVSFGVRAIETQTRSIGVHAPVLNDRLSQVASDVAALTDLTAARSSGVGQER